MSIYLPLSKWSRCWHDTILELHMSRKCYKIYNAEPVLLLSRFLQWFESYSHATARTHLKLSIYSETCVKRPLSKRPKIGFSKLFYWPFLVEGGTSFVDLLCFCSFLCLLCLVRVFLYVLCGPLLGKGWPVMSNCEFVTFPLVSWFRCGTWLYRFLIFAPLLTFQYQLLLNAVQKYCSMLL